MARYRMVRTDFWKNPVVMEEMTPEDKYFYVYLLTNPQTTQIGIYKITKKQMAFDLGYSIESVHALMERFTLHHKLIRYNPETRELAIKNWGKENLQNGGKPVMDCIFSELKEVEDYSLIPYVSESIHKQEIRHLYESFCKPEEIFLGTEFIDQDENDTYETECEEMDDTLLTRHTIGGQKEKQKEKEKQKQQQKDFPLNSESHLDNENPLLGNQKNEEIKEIVEFWDNNGFGFTNENAKQQLLAWLDDSHFLQPKEMILKAMNIACANNKRKLNYVVGILRNWENESLLTVEEIDSYQEKQKTVRTTRQVPAGRDIPRDFVLDLTRGEK
ncbi:DnaD domain-containing protein [Neobacillus bataviensis]|nr:DnaD domain protein [Neobacillus bataviensis]